jgi:hypothetical protein
MIYVLPCLPLVKRVLQIAEALFSRRISAITLGPDITVVLPSGSADDERLMKHEAKHREQAARFLPTWARGARNPLKGLGNKVAMVRFLDEYMRIYKDTGYKDHPWEIEARAAETT